MELAEALRVRPVADDVFAADVPGSGYLFGGWAVALSLLAAAETAPAGSHPKSVQVHFLQSGEWGRALTLRVGRHVDSRSFSSRSVSVFDGDRQLAVALTSFHRPQEGADWQDGPAPAVPAPDELEPATVYLPLPLIEVRRVVGPAHSFEGSWHPYWARAAGNPPDDHLLTRAVIGFISDYVVIASLQRADAVSPSDTVRTISHALWFHRPSRAGAWHLFSSDPLTVSEGRGLTLGRIHSESGDLVASFVQEVNIRP